MLWLAHLLWDGIQKKIFYRGVVSFGPIVIGDSNTVIGPAVSDAAAWYEKADCFGIFATPTCGIFINHLRLIRENIDYTEYGKDLGEICHDTMISAAAETWSKALTRYKIPLHQGDKEMWVVSWPYAARRCNNDDSNKAKIAFSTALNSLPRHLPVGVEIKYEKSVQFFDNWVENFKE